MGVVCKRCRRNHGRAGVRRRLEFQEILGFLEQSNISRRNRKRLEALAGSEDVPVRVTAAMVLKVATLAPRRPGRLRILEERNPELLRLLLFDFPEPER